MARQDTSAQILDIARDILSQEGAGTLSFDAIARRLGKSKQAVLYWYPSKHALLAALYLPWLEAEADTAVAAMNGVEATPDAVRAFVRAVAAFHLADLDRFRLMYLAPQTQRGTRSDGVAAQVPQVTDRLYGALAERLTGPRARAEATAIHAAVLGVVMMVALGEAVEDPLKHDAETLVTALADRLAGQAA